MAKDCTRTASEYRHHVEALSAFDADLGRQVAGFRGIGEVLAWMKERGLTQAAVDIVGLDEFHYDFLLQLEPGGRWLAFGVT